MPTTDKPVVLEINGESIYVAQVFNMWFFSRRPTSSSHWVGASKELSDSIDREYALKFLDGPVWVCSECRRPLPPESFRETPAGSGIRRRQCGDCEHTMDLDAAERVAEHFRFAARHGL